MAGSAPRLEPAFHEAGPAARAPFAGLAVTDVPPRRTPRTPGSRMMSITQPRSIPAGSRPCADDRARVLRHPYTAMKEPAWASRMPRAGASRPAAMRLPRVRIRARQPHVFMFNGFKTG